MNCSTIEWRITTAAYAHQRAAVEKLSRLKVGGLFMDMGTGKTRVAIELVWLRRHKISQCVWFCPVSLMETARREILKHTTCADADIHVFGPQTRESSLTKAGWYIVGLESLGSSARVVCTLDKLIDEKTFIVVDESTYIKGHRAKRTNRLIVLGKRTAYRLLLTGTPITQGIEDLYTQMTFLSPKILDYHSWYTFRRHHILFDQHKKGLIVDRYDTRTIYQRIAPYVYEVRKEDCLDLPPKTYKHVWCFFSEEQQRLYQAVKERFYDDLMEYDPSETGVAIYRLFGGLHAVSCGVRPAGFVGDKLLKNGRAEILTELLNGINESHVIVWVNYIASIDALREAFGAAFPHRGIFELRGNISPRLRTENIDKWKRDGGILLATQGTGGHGLTLTEANYTFFYSDGWKYSDRLQAEDRCHRIGQTRNVYYVTVRCECGLDKRIRSALLRKSNALQELKNEVALLNGDRAQIKSLVETL